MENFRHYIPTIIYFGRGQISSLCDELRSRAKRLLMVTGMGSIKRAGIYDKVITQIKKAGIKYLELSGVQPNPRLKLVYDGIDICRKESVDLILAAGGGSVIDTAKAVAVGAKTARDVWDFYEKDIYPEEALPVGVVLTLAATGSEMNGNSVISNEQTRRKLALCTPLIRPVFSILDPEFTYTVSAYHSAAGVADIMAHVFEQYFSHTPSAALQDAIAESILKICIRYGPVICSKPSDYDARANILWAGTLALNDLIGEGKVTDWSSHRIEHELSAEYDISHGAGLAIITPNWMRYVLDKDTVRKFTDYGRNVWHIDDADEFTTAEEAIENTRSFFKSLGLSTSLGEAGIGEERLETMADRAVSTYGELGAFKKLGRDDIVNILRNSL